MADRSETDYEKAYEYLAQRGYIEPRAKSSAPAIIIAIVLVAALVALTFFAARTLMDGQAPAGADASNEFSLEATDSEHKIATADDIDFALTRSLIDALPGDEGTTYFTLSELEAPNPTDAQRAAIGELTSAIEEQTDSGLGFLFVDLDSGRGISHNLDAEVYGASSIKGPYAAYICEELVESGRVSLDDSCTVNQHVDTSVFPVGGSYTVEELVEGMVLYSDNNAIGALRDAFDGEGYDEWAERLGIYDAESVSGDYFPDYSARSSAKFWNEIERYLEKKTKTAIWLESLYADTSVSFIRDAIGSDNVIVENKAGWYTESGDQDHSVCDAGIVIEGDRTFLMCLMSDMPADGANEASLGDLAAALFAIRDTL